MAYKYSGNCIKRLSDNASIPMVDGNRDYEAYKIWVEDGGQTKAEFTEEEIAEKEKQASIDAIIATYEAAIAEPVECTDLDGNVYHMDGLHDSAALMRDGIQLAELTGQTSIDITDYYNRTHYGIALENARAIMLQQAASFAALRAKKCADREAVLYPDEVSESMETEATGDKNA